MQQSGGFVRLESKLGVGTMVRLYLPRHEEVGQGSEQQTEGTGAGTDADRAVMESMGFTVLVVEDEAAIRSQIAQALRELDYRVVEAENADVGLRVVQSDQPIDLLLADVGLPGLNGRQFADAARLRRPNLPVLLITGFPEKTLKNAVIMNGMDVMGKPFTLEALTERVQAMLGTPSFGVGKVQSIS